MSRGRVRITGGALRGRTVGVPAGVRPSEGRLREALFSIWGERVAGCRFLDLFAGSGVVGFEALSRGAVEAVAVDDDPQVVRALDRNAERLGGVALAVRRARLPGELARAVAGPEAPGEGGFGLVFADPPYRFDRHAELLAAAAAVLAPGGELALEHDARIDLPEVAGSLIRRELRRYGGSALALYAHA